MATLINLKSDISEMTFISLSQWRIHVAIKQNKKMPKFTSLLSVDLMEETARQLIIFRNHASWL